MNAKDGFKKLLTLLLATTLFLLLSVVTASAEGPAPTALYVPPVSINYGYYDTLTANLTSDGVGLPGQTILFEIDGQAIGTAVTDASGVAALPSFQWLKPEGTYQLVASFGGSDLYSPTSSADTITGLKSGVVMSTSAPLSGTYGSTVAFEGDLYYVADLYNIGPAADRQLLVSVEGRQVAQGITDSTGNATIPWTIDLPAGTYTGRISFLGDDTLIEGWVIRTLNVSAIPGTLTYEGDTTVATSGPFNARVTFTPDGGAQQLPPQTVQFVLQQDGTVMATWTAVADSAGTAIVSPSPTVPPGSYTLEISPQGEAYWSAPTLSVPVKAHTALVLDGPWSVNASLPVNLRATLSAGTTGLAGKTVRFTVNGIPLGSAVTDQSGVATLTYLAAPPVGTYQVDACFDGDSSATPSCAQNSLTIYPAQTSLSLNVPANIAYGSEISITATLSPAVPGKPLTWRVNGVDQPPVVTDAAGMARLPYTVQLPAGTYTVAVNFAGDSDYVASSTEEQLAVGKVTGTLTYSGDTLTTGGPFHFAGHFTPDQGAIPPGEVMIVFVLRQNGALKWGCGGTVDASGDAVCDLNSPSGSYDLTLELQSNPYFIATSGPILIRGTPSVSVSNFIATTGTTANLKATLFSGGDRVAGVSVEFQVNGQPVGTATTDAQGVATFPYLLTQPAGDLPYSVSFAGNSRYTAVSGSGTVGVQRIAPDLTTTSPTVAVRGTATLSATLTAGGKPLAGRTIEFYVGVVKIGTAVTDANGVATLAYETKSTGTFQILAQYRGDGYYYSNQATGTLTVTRK